MRPIDTTFNWAAFHRGRKIYKIGGLGLVLFGLFTIVNMMTEEFIKLTGWRAIFAGTTLILCGLLALYKGYKLPLEEALDLVHRKGRGITESELVHDMRVDRATARRILDGLIAKGFLRRGSDQSGATEEVFEPVK
ncbi:MAG: hypothetical protein WCS70_15370 [Verrucomicrobiota bacterium]